MAKDNGVVRLWRALGPGLITGAADDDPSGIATYSQAGAQFGYALTWTMLLTLPFMAAIQIISAVIGWETRQGLSRNIARRLPPVALYGLIALLVIANTINIAADLAAMGESLRLVIAGPAVAYAVAFGVASLMAEILIPYHCYAGYLKFLTVVLFAYVIVAFSIHIPWGEVIAGTVWPRVSLTKDMLLTVVAVFGTTISPYLFFWQASQEAEESRLSMRHRYGKSDGKYFRHIAFDTWTGMIVSNLIGFFIIVTTAATLHAHGATHVQTASQAAEALKPIAGAFTFALFAGGIIGTGLLAVPVLAGSAAYAVTEAFHMRGSLELPANRAIGFYAIVSAATLAGAGLTLTKLDPIAMLFWAAVINGFVAVPVMIAMMLVVARKSETKLNLPLWLKVLGWLAAVLMTIAVALLLWSEMT
ncbi:MAG TPA: divalent metal cation transporter [Rhizomicrobium sp.]|jgi:NRAMP (natural resistance-associated macrophage protein)-like metal ion transporter